MVSNSPCWNISNYPWNMVTRTKTCLQSRWNEHIPTTWGGGVGGGGGKGVKHEQKHDHGIDINPWSSRKRLSCHYKSLAIAHYIPAMPSASALSVQLHDTYPHQKNVWCGEVCLKWETAASAFMASGKKESRTTQENTHTHTHTRTHKAIQGVKL